MRSLSVFILSIVFFAGCATTPVVKPVLVWPDAPEAPRYLYLDSYFGELSYVEFSIWDRLFGVPALPYPMQNPTGVFANKDRIYVAAPGSHHVVVMDTTKRQISYLGREGKGRLTRPYGISGMPDGSLIFVSDIALKRVFAFDPNGALKIRFGDGNEMRNPVGLAVNSSLGRLYVVDSREHNVHVYSLTGKLLFSFGRPGYGDGQFAFPTSAAIDQKNGNVYVVDTQNFRVQVFDQEGKYLSQFGKLGDGYGNFVRPKGVALDSEGHVYVVDAAFDAFQVFDANNAVLLMVGGGGNGPGQFSLPEGIFIDTQDRVYVADTLNSRVQVFQYLSDKWKAEHPEEYSKLLHPETGEQITEEKK